MSEQTGNGHGEHGGGEQQPNVLIIMVDQMRWDLLSCAGHPVCRTPVLDGHGRARRALCELL